MVDERTAADVISQRPAEAVLHQARPVLLGRPLPQLLEAETVLLRLAPFSEAELGLDLLSQRAARALGDQHIAAVDLHARLVVGARLAVLAHAHDPGHDSAQGAVLVVERLGSREAGIDLHAQRLGLRRQPAAEVGQ